MSDKTFSVLLNEKHIDDIQGAIEDAENEGVNEPCVRITAKITGTLISIAVVGKRTIEEDYKEEVPTNNE